MNLKQEMSLGVMVFVWFPKSTWIQKAAFLEIHQKCNSGIVGKVKKVFVFPMFLWIPEVRNFSCPSRKVFVFPMVLSGSQKGSLFKKWSFLGSCIFCNADEFKTWFLVRLSSGTLLYLLQALTPRRVGRRHTGPRLRRASTNRVQSGYVHWMV